ncbi:C-C chemokine receptor type 6-like [Alosa alosa]|uniref:C-C chemokine receptor type 6-like n=1 Tax=Alosa alosa TaxID=278164 RepID=UPI0020152DE4|nr:C-C chemokine receptor type 6-like [Alosa alosa]
MANATEDYNMKYPDNSLSEMNYDDYYGYGDDGLCYTQVFDNVYYHLSLYVHSIIVVLGLLGNLLVIVTYAFYKKTKSMTDVYLLNVAVADVFFVVVLPFIIYNEQHGWVMGDGACKVLSGAYSLNLYSGVLLLACISGDRYLAIVRASSSRYLRSRTLVYSHAICFTVWVMALLLSLPTFLYSTTYQPRDLTVMLGVTPENSTDEELVECRLYFNSTETADLMKVLIPSLQMGIGFLLPLMVMTFCYTCIILTLLKARNFQRHKAVRVVLTVVLVFVLCHLPYNLTRLAYTITLGEERECPAEISFMVGLSITETLAYLHCCLNPFLYAFVGVRFRNHFQKVLRDLWCVGKDYMRARRPSSRITSEVCLSMRKSLDGSNTDHATSFTM